MLKIPPNPPRLYPKYIRRNLRSKLLHKQSQRKPKTIIFSKTKIVTPLNRKAKKTKITRIHKKNRKEKETRKIQSKIPRRASKRRTKKRINFRKRRKSRKGQKFC